MAEKNNINNKIRFCLAEPTIRPQGRYTKRFKINGYNSTSYHHETVGSLERSHAEYLKQYIDKNRDDWDEFLELSMFSYNTSIHSGTKYSPYELVFGTDARLPSQRPLTDHEQLPTYEGYLKELILRLTQIRKLAHDNLVENKEKSKEHYDKTSNHVIFNVGDLVFLQKGPKPHKFGDRYTGPHKILEILPSENVRIDYKNSSIIVHANRLKLFKID